MLYDFFFFKQNTAYEMRISDWSSDVCSSDLGDDPSGLRRVRRVVERVRQRRLVLDDVVRGHGPEDGAGPAFLRDDRRIGECGRGIAAERLQQNAVGQRRRDGVQFVPHPEDMALVGNLPDAIPPPPGPRPPPRTPDHVDLSGPRAALPRAVRPSDRPQTRTP